MLSTTSTIRAPRTSMRRNRNLGGYRVTSATMGPVSTSLFLIVIVGILALLYLTQITKTTVYGYQVSNLSDQRQTLLDQNQELQVQAARLQAIARVQNSKVASALQPQSQASFVSAP